MTFSLAARATELRVSRHALVTDILDRIDERARDTQSWADHCTRFANELAVVTNDLRATGDATGLWHHISSALRLALQRLVGLGHDLELVLVERVLLARSGLSLDRLFDPYESFGGAVKFEQDGTASVVHRSGPDCLVSAPGEAAIDVPIVLTRPGATLRGRINATLALATPPGSRGSYERLLTRGAHFCPGSEFSSAEQMLILGQVGPALELVVGPLPLPALPNLPLGRPAFYAGQMGELVSLPATIRKRTRRYVAPLASIPAWADAALKLVPDALIRYIGEEVRKNGASIVAGPTYHLGGFDITVRRQDNYTRRVGCVDFGIVVTITIVLQCSLSVDAVPQFIIRILDIGRDINVDIKPDVLTDILEHFTNIAIDFVEGFLRLVNRELTFPLHGVERAEVDVSADRIVLNLKTRELPF
jgi:hypothetical protein